MARQSRALRAGHQRRNFPRIPLWYRERRGLSGAGMELALIPAGTFLMGSPPDEDERSQDEGPRHEVEVTAPFYLGVYPVTQGQWHRVLGSNPSHFRPGGGGEDEVRGLDTGNFP